MNSQNITKRLERLEQEIRPPEVWRINRRIVRPIEGGGGIVPDEVNYASYWVGREEVSLWRAQGEPLEQFEERSFQAAFKATGFFDITTSCEQCTI